MKKINKNVLINIRENIHFEKLVIVRKLTAVSFIFLTSNTFGLTSKNIAIA